MRRAFTYVELVVVIAILFIVSAIIMPRLAAMRKGREEREFKNAIRDLSSKARSRAIDSGDVVSLRYDKTTGKLSAVERNADGAELPLKAIAPPTDVTPYQFVSNQDAGQGNASQGNAVPGNGGQGDAWEVPFYADGTSSGGGVEFEAGDRHFSVVVYPADGESRIVEGPMPDLSLNRWPAGTYAKR